MDDALRAPAGLPWITMMPLSTAPTFAHNLHSLHHYEKKSLQTKIQDTREETAEWTGAVGAAAMVMGFVDVKPG